MKELILDKTRELFLTIGFKSVTMDQIANAMGISKKTIYNAYVWNQFHRPTAKGKSIAVVQGKTYEEIVECYQTLDEKLDVDMIAISFDYSLYEEMVPHPNKLVSWMLGRVALLGRLEKDGVINKLKPHYKEVIELKCFNELSYKEISIKLNQPINNIKVKVLRAKKILFQLISEND